MKSDFFNLADGALIAEFNRRLRFNIKEHGQGDTAKYITIAIRTEPDKSIVTVNEKRNSNDHRAFVLEIMKQHNITKAQARRKITAALRQVAAGIIEVSAGQVHDAYAQHAFRTKITHFDHRGLPLIHSEAANDGYNTPDSLANLRNRNFKPGTARKFEIEMTKTEKR
jgi:hypothetical protein